MASSTNTLTIRVPAVLKKRIEKVSALQGVSINQFALYAFTKEIAELEKQSFLDGILSNINKKQLVRAVDEILAGVPEGTVPEWDRLPDAHS